MLLDLNNVNMSDFINVMNYWDDIFQVYNSSISFLNKQQIEEARLYFLSKRVLYKTDILSEETEFKINNLLQPIKKFLEDDIDAKVKNNVNIDGKATLQIYLYGKLCLMLGDIKGMDFLENAIKKSCVPAMIDLGLKYVYGYPEPMAHKLRYGMTVVDIPEKLIAPNKELAMSMFELAIKSGNGEAAFILGNIFKEGQKILYEYDDYCREYKYGIIDKDEKKAEFYFLVAKKLGFVHTEEFYNGKKLRIKP